MMNTNVVFSMMVCALLVTSSSSQECPGPVSFNSPDFTIRGPCPNDTVLVAVGSTIQYRCDYTDGKPGTDLPYWHIPELSGTPFLEGDGSEHGITVFSTISVEGHTTLAIPVKEQYLNNTLNIQCGLCSLSSFDGDGCDKENRLSENITSIPPVKLVTFGAPRNLNSSINSSTGIVSLYWNPPITSADYNCTSEQQQCWIYEVQLINEYNQSQIITWETHDNQLEIRSGFNITENELDTCISYKWNVTAVAVSSGHKSDQAEGPTIVLQKVSNITSSATYKVMNCSSNITVTAIFNVVAIQPLDTLEYFTVLNITDIVYSFISNNISIVFTANTVSLSISFPSNLMDNDDSTVVYAVVGVSNECGVDTTDQHEVPFDNVTTCSISASSLIDSSTSKIKNTVTSDRVYSSIEILPLTVTESLSVMATILSTNRSTDSSTSPSIIGVIVGCVCAGVFVFIILPSIIGCIILYTRYSVHFSPYCVKNINSPMNISPPTTMNQVYGIKVNNDPLSSSTEQTQEELEQQMNIYSGSVKSPSEDDDGDNI